MIDILLLLALGYAIGWAIDHPDKVKAAWNSLLGK
jgi:hypothetical protein